MEILEMTREELEARKAQIAEEINVEGADLDALEAEARSINSELEHRVAVEAEKAEQRAAVAEMVLPVAEENPIEERKMENIEIRNTDAYIEAYAKYIKTGNDSECRALLTENGSGQVAVPELVYNIVKNAWEKEGIMRLVKKTYIKGNLKIGFEISSSEAVVHTEGQSVDEESLVNGIVTLVPAAIKKWISISDEALDMSAVPYLQYIYDELTYRIAKKAADELIGKIVAAGTQSTSTAVAVAKITSTTISTTLVAEAIAHLSDQASNPTVIMNKLTYADFKKAQASANYPVDPFEGCQVVFNNSLTAFTAATTGVTYMIVGDLGEGALANFPAGEEIQVKRDDYTLATSDLVRFIGREYVALGIVSPDAFCKVCK